MCTTSLATAWTLRTLCSSSCRGGSATSRAVAPCHGQRTASRWRPAASRAWRPARLQPRRRETDLPLHAPRRRRRARCRKWTAPCWASQCRLILLGSMPERLTGWRASRGPVRRRGHE
uniref:Uncharacterized protein n=1 Tax=Ixodes ricinus TaxID=34613 RepID=A0A6B0ULR9_IXORI